MTKIKLAPTPPTLDDILATVPPKKSRTALAGNPALVEAVVRYLDLKAANDPRAHVSLAWLYNNKLRAAFGGPSFDAVRRYVRDVLRRDIATGKVLA